MSLEAVSEARAQIEARGRACSLSSSAGSAQTRRMAGATSPRRRRAASTLTCCLEWGVAVQGKHRAEPARLLALARRAAGRERRVETQELALLAP